MVLGGRTGAIKFSCGHPAGVAPGVAGDDLFKAALLGMGRPKSTPPAGSRPYWSVFTGDTTSGGE